MQFAKKKKKTSSPERKNLAEGKKLLVNAWFEFK